MLTMIAAINISIHALREEGDRTIPCGMQKFQSISIHALREEGDARSWPKRAIHGLFLSTPSARRATCFPYRDLIIA